ncbi:MAG: hypothetical protein ACK526_14195, partial [Planctomyces sp.]
MTTNHQNHSDNSASSGASSTKTLLYIIVGTLGFGILFIVGSAVLHEQDIESRRRAIAVAGGKSELIRVVPGWLKSIAGEDFHSFLDQTTISKITMTGEKIGDEQVKALAAVSTVPTLTELDLEASNITSEGLASVILLKELRILNLSQTD